MILSNYTNIFWILRNKKVLFVIKQIILLPLSIIIITTIRIISPILLIRIARVFTERIGHLALDLELKTIRYKKEIKTRKIPFIVDIYVNNEISNSYLFYLWESQGNFIFKNNMILQQIATINRFLPDHKKYNQLLTIHTDGHWNLKYLDNTKPALSFPKNDEELGWELLEKLGIHKNTKYVVFCIRNSDYLERKYPNHDWSYHEYRNSDAEDYLEAAEALVELGYSVIIMGKTNHLNKTTINKNVIYYAELKFRTEFLDIFLMANTYFTISTSTGIDAVSTIFRRPVGLVNTVLGRSISLGSTPQLYQPKFVKDVSSGKYLGIEDLLKIGWQNFSSFEDYRNAGLEIRNNTSTEIKQFVLEFEKLQQYKKTKYTGDDLKENLIRKISNSWGENILQRNNGEMRKLLDGE